MRAKKILFSLEVFLVFLSLTFYLWYITESSDRQKHLQTTEISANQLKNGIESFVNEKISILLQVRNFWINSRSVTHDQFLAFCREIISQIPGFQAIEFEDPSNKVVWIEPFVGSELAEHFGEASEPIRQKMLELAIRKRTVTVTHAGHDGGLKVSSPSFPSLRTEIMGERFSESSRSTPCSRSSSILF
jgi:sensor domain CHASE-containing protein